MATEPVWILLIRPWTEPIGLLREALQDGGITAHISCVDIEPALVAELGRAMRIDVVVHDPATPGISRAVLEARLREYRRPIPIVTLDRLEDLAQAIIRALAEWSN